MTRLASALERVDRVLALAWWWQWKLVQAERKLAAALASHGESSFAALSATTAVRRAQFAVEYGRAVSPEVQLAVQRLADAGVPKHILRLMVINLDIRVDSSQQIFVRRDWWLSALAWSSRVLVIAGMSFFCLQILAHPADRPVVKILLLLAFGVFFFSAAYVWDLFGVRALRANRAYANLFERANLAVRSRYADIWPMRRD